MGRAFTTEEEEESETKEYYNSRAGFDPKQTLFCNFNKTNRWRNI